MKNRGIIIFTLGLLSALGPFSIDMYLPGFPAIAKELHSSIAHVQLSLTSYFVGISLGQLIYGPLIDRFGRMKPLYVGLIIYVLASLGCTLAPSVNLLILLRFLQAIGGCAGLVVSRTLVRDIFPVKENARIFSLLVLVIGISPVLAPTVGGYLTEHFGWQSIFLVLTVLSAITLFLTFRFLPAGAAPDTEMSLRPASIIRQFKEVFQNRQFRLFAIAAGISSAGMFAYISGSSFTFMDYFNVSEKTFGWIFAVNAAGLIIASQVNRYLLKKSSEWSIIRLVAAVQLVAGVLLFVFARFDWLDLRLTILLLFIFLAMQGFLFPNTSALSMAPFSRGAGMASALMGFLQMFFSAIASALVSVLHDGTLVPMTATMAVCGMIGFTIIYYTVYTTKRVSYLS